jgi:hypothetical protein
MVLEGRGSDRLAGRSWLCLLGRFGPFAPGKDHIERCEQQRINEDGDNGAGEDEIAPLLGKKLQA